MKMNMLRNVRKRVNAGALNLYVKGKAALKNEKGWGLIETIIVGAVLVIALLSLESPISTFFSGVWSDFSTWIDTKLTALFS